MCKAGVTLYSTFAPHFMCWKTFDENFMDKNLLHIIFDQV